MTIQYPNFIDNPEYHKDKKEFSDNIILMRKRELKDFYSYLSGICFHRRHDMTDILYDVYETHKPADEIFDHYMDGNEYWYYSGFETIEDLKPYVIIAFTALKEKVGTLNPEDWSEQTFEYYTSIEKLINFTRRESLIFSISKYSDMEKFYEDSEEQANIN